MNICNGKLKKRLKAGELMIAGQANMFSGTAIIEILFEAGYNMITIDLEHSALTIGMVSEQIRIARALDIPCMVRVAHPEYDNLNRILDQGPDGVVIPRIRNAEEVRHIINMIRYPPDGVRGLAGYGCPLSKYHGWQTLADQIRNVNENTVLGIQIETLEALNSMEEILSIPGIDIALVGCDDLTAAMGIPGKKDDSLFQDAVTKFIRVCHDRKIAAGIPCSTPEKAIELIDRGIRVLWYGVDAGLLWEGASRRINGLNEKLADKGFKKF